MSYILKPAYNTIKLYNRENKRYTEYCLYTRKVLDLKHITMHYYLSHEENWYQIETISKILYHLFNTKYNIDIYRYDVSKTYYIVVSGINIPKCYIWFNAKNNTFKYKSSGDGMGFYNSYFGDNDSKFLTLYNKYYIESDN